MAAQTDVTRSGVLEQPGVSVRAVSVDERSILAVVHGVAVVAVANQVCGCDYGKRQESGRNQNNHLLHFVTSIVLLLDDFGTGYSSLSYLKRLPFDVIKVDRSFVRDIVTDPDDAAIITAILSLADRLKLQVVAEGVESLAQHEFLRLEGCRQAQGYHYARPLDSEKALQYLNADDRDLYAVN